MKKVLFTLAAIVAFGFANAANVPTFAFSQNEVELGAGDEVELAIVLTGIDSYMKACDWTFNMVDPAGNLIESKVKLEYLQKYGARTRYQFFGKTGICADNENTVSTSDGQHATNATMTTTGIYKCILSNAASNVCFYNDEATPANILLFTVTVEEGWEDEYAEFKFVDGFCVMMDSEAGEAGTEMAVAPFSLKINNKDYQAPQPQLEDFNGNIVIGEPNEDGVVNISYTGTETGYTMTVTVDGTPVTPDENGNITVTEGTHNIEVVISKEGYNNKEAEQEVTYTAPVIIDKPAVPEITINMDDDNVYVGATNQEGATTVLYLVTGYDENDEPILQEITNPTPFERGDENYTVQVMAIATNEGGSTSSEIITIPVPMKEPLPPSGINELINGKNVANVRYFNVAGQEMQEANGMTIMVVTYTDGTTSTMKVMK